MLRLNLRSISTCRSHIDPISLVLGASQTQQPYATGGPAPVCSIPSRILTSSVSGSRAGHASFEDTSSNCSCFILHSSRGSLRGGGPREIGSQGKSVGLKLPTPLGSRSVKDSTTFLQGSSAVVAFSGGGLVAELSLCGSNEALGRAAC